MKESKAFVIALAETIVTFIGVYFVKEWLFSFLSPVTAVIVLFVVLILVFILYALVETYFNGPHRGFRK